MKDKCPCIDCVVLAMCKARIQPYKDLNYHYPGLLRYTCSLFKEYYHIYAYHSKIMKRQKLITDKVFGVNNER